GEQPIGSLSINYEDDDIFLYGVAVAKNQRGKGFGKELVKFAQNIAFREEKKIVLDVDSDNPVAFSLYKSCGFVIDFQVDYYRTNIK
ncbi:MAG: GNAT family N-acetyltransferase, partial [Oscillospiraceae bacterium]